MSKDKPLPKGVTCECGKEHPFSAWVYAHWDILLTLTCTCGRKYILRKGKATPTNENEIGKKRGR